jgi:putative transcriptional regulator
VDPTLRERLERLGPVRTVDVVPDGSPEVLTLRGEAKGCEFLTVRAALALARRGLSLLEAKRADEILLDESEVTVRLPGVESRDVLARELSAAGILALPHGNG